MASRESLKAAVPRRRGRPVGSDSAETRNRILAASRQVINERGYQAATFQAIALVAGLSRPTLHYYFASREEIYGALVAEAGEVVAGCIAASRRPGTLVEQFTSLVDAMHQVDRENRSQIAFLVSARLESTRNPELHVHAGTVLRDFLMTLVQDARTRGELPDDAAMVPVVEMLHAMLWGLGFYAGFVDDATDMCSIAAQLDVLLSHGLGGIAAKSSRHGDTYGDTPSAVGGRP